MRLGVSPLTTSGMNGIIRQVFRRSSAVEQVAVNDKVAGSNPAAGAKHKHYDESHSVFVLLELLYAYD